MKLWQTSVAMGVIVALGSFIQYWWWPAFPSVGVCVALAYLVGVSRRAAMDDRSGWEEHPCVMPGTDGALGAQGRIWACRCGRRWKLLRVERFNGQVVETTWTEWTPEKALAEAEKNFKKLGMQGTPLPSTLDAIERDR